MSLTLKVEQRLTAVGLVDFFEADRNSWHDLAREMKEFRETHKPNGSVIRRDDVAESLVPLLEVNEALAACLQERKLTQKYWVRWFADLIIDRTWPSISTRGHQ